MPFISVSGPKVSDIVTQLALLPRRQAFRYLEPVECYSTDLQQLHVAGATWWLGRLEISEISDEDVVRIIRGAYWSREAAAEGKDEGLIFVDGDGLMAEAICVALIAHRSRIPVETALHRLQTILSGLNDGFPPNFPLADIRILLLPQASETPDAIANAYSPVEVLLLRWLHRQKELGNFTSVIIRKVEDSPLYTHDILCASIAADFKRLSKHTGRPAPDILPVWHAVLFVAFGGLSESGKSAVAQGTVERANARGVPAIRLKIGYLLELASREQRIDIYELTPREQALALLHQADLFCRAHHWVRVVTLESVHRYDQVRELQLLMGGAGGRFLLVYLDTPLELRRSRTEAAGEEFDPRKDETKRGRGAHRVREIADVVLRNEGPLEHTLDDVASAINKSLSSIGCATN